MKHVKISIYINEADKWQHHPLYLELLNVLHAHQIAGATVLRAMAGFTLNNPVQTTSLVDIGSKLPLVVQFVDTVAKVDTVLPELKARVGERLIISESVTILSLEK